MHIIFSESFDVSTNKVIDWLISYNQKYFRSNGYGDYSGNFNFGDLHNSLYISNNNSKILIKLSKDSYNNTISEIKSVWFRRPYTGVKDMVYDCDNIIGIIPKPILKKALNNHARIMKKTIFELISQRCKIVIGSFSITELNKFMTLIEAQRSGLCIPNTLVTNVYEDAVKFFTDNKCKIICKPLHEVVSFSIKETNETYTQFTKLIDNVNLIPENFDNTLFQEYVEKDFEIRTFFFKGKTHSMAILGNEYEESIVDFRAGIGKNLRMVPYKLNEVVDTKVNNLMRIIGLNMASIDLIKSSNGKIYFLEINPVGQYDFLSDNCNYHLDYEIAKEITNEKSNN